MDSSNSTPVSSARVDRRILLPVVLTVVFTLMALASCMSYVRKDRRRRRQQRRKLIIETIRTIDMWKMEAMYTKLNIRKFLLANFLERIDQARARIQLAQSGKTPLAPKFFVECDLSDAECRSWMERVAAEDTGADGGRGRVFRVEAVKTPRDITRTYSSKRLVAGEEDGLSSHEEELPERHGVVANEETTPDASTSERSAAASLEQLRQPIPMEYDHLYQQQLQQQPRQQNQQRQEKTYHHDKQQKRPQQQHEQKQQQLKRQREQEQQQPTQQRLNEQTQQSGQQQQQQQQQQQHQQRVPQAFRRNYGGLHGQLTPIEETEGVVAADGAGGGGGGGAGGGFGEEPASRLDTEARRLALIEYFMRERYSVDHYWP